MPPARQAASRRSATTAQPEAIDLETGERRPLCVDCGEPFAYSGAEVAARRSRGRPYPGRCPACRAAHLAARNARFAARYAAGEVGPEIPPAPGPDGGEGPLSVAVCAGCGRTIRLPFRPRADRPVFCRFCLEARRGR